MRVICYVLLMIGITILISACFNPIEQTAIVQFRNKSILNITVYVVSGKNDISKSSVLSFTLATKKEKHITIRWKEYGNLTMRVYWKYKKGNIELFTRGDEIELKSGDEKPLDFKSM